MKRLFASLLLFVLVAAPTIGARDLYSRTLASLVRIEFPVEGQDGPGICTGFMVAPRRALTAAHCVPDEAGFTVDGVDSLLIKRDAQFALVSAGSKPALTFAKKLKLQELTTSFGFAWGDMFVLQRRVAAFKDGDFATDGPLAPGMSGGPTVNQAGEVVGINQAANSVIGIICGAGEIQAFLKR